MSQPCSHSSNRPLGTDHVRSGRDLIPAFTAPVAPTNPTDSPQPVHASPTVAFLPPTTSPRWQHLHGLDLRALHRLPGSEGDDPYARLVAAWLLTLTSTHTTRAYAAEAAAFARWCTEHDLHPFEVERWHLDAYRLALTTAPTRTGRPRAAATISRALSALAGLYCLAPTLKEALNPLEDESHGGTEEVPR